MTYRVVEKFVSINGEGQRAGQLAVFIRFAGCNLKCVYCDTMWANEADVEYSDMTAEEIYQYIKETEIQNVTLTGGEPLVQEDIRNLLRTLAEDESLNIEVETNGSIALEEFNGFQNRPSFTMDYKLSSSKMEQKMCLENLKGLCKQDTLKFVVGCSEDLDRAENLIREFDLINNTSVYFSPVFDALAYEDIVEFMKTRS